MMRAYREDESVEVGQVVSFGFEPFGTGLITKVEGDLVCVERPHMRIDGPVKSQSAIMIERINIFLEDVKKMQVETYKGEIVLRSR